MKKRELVVRKNHSHSQPDEPTARLDEAIRDRSVSTSVISICPDFLKDAIDRIPNEAFTMTDREINCLFRKPGQYDAHAEIDEKLRISFWREYHEAAAQGKALNIRAVIAGICQYGYFIKNFVSHPWRLAYMLVPPADYVTTMEELLKLGLEQIRDILLLPHIDPVTGRPDARMADVKMKILERVENRVKGMVAHRVETRNLNLNAEVEAPTRKLSGAENLTTIEEIEARLSELRGEALDVTPKE